MRLAWLLFLLVISACVKTHDKLLTAHELCQQLKHLDDPDEFRDPYDNCLLFTDEELKSQEGCLARCEGYCGDLRMLYQDMWIDFAGCHCYCKVKLR